MYLFYADESGDPRSLDQRCFIYAGVVVFERRTHWISQALDEIAARFDSQNPNAIELHGSPMFFGRKKWGRYPRNERVAAIKDALRLIDQEVLIASVVDKKHAAPQDPFFISFEQIITRFDHFLRRLYQAKREQARGLAIFDKSHKEKDVQHLARQFKDIGHKWGALNNMAEVPVFIDSQASRLIQLADLVAYALFRHYERGDSQFYEIIRHKFYRDHKTVHGLHLALP